MSCPSKGERIRYGIMLKKLICDKYNLKIDDETTEWFNAFYDGDLEESIKQDIETIMSLIPRKKPKQYVSKRRTKAVVDFYMSYNKTMTIRMCKKGYVPPRVLGQAGVATINFYYMDILDKKVNNREDVRKMYSDKEILCKIIPRLIYYLLPCDYNIFKLDNAIEVISKFEGKMELSAEKIEITKSYKYPHISYDGIPIMEIAYVRSTPNVRININNVAEFIERVKVKNVNSVRGSLGAATEKAICNIYGLRNNISYNNEEQISRVTPYIKRVLEYNNVNPAEYVGGIKGEKEIEKVLCKTKKRVDHYILGAIKGFGSHMSSPIDFFSSEDLSISVKTTKNSNYLVCPDTIGQPTAASCLKLIKKIVPDFDKEITPKVFIDIIMDRTHLKSLIMKYIEYLFLCKYLLYLGERNGDIQECLLLDRDSIDQSLQEYKWNEEDFYYAKSKEKMLYDIYESTTSNGHATLQIDYQGVRIGQFDIFLRQQYIYEFRFNFKSLLGILEINM